VTAAIKDEIPLPGNFSAEVFFCFFQLPIGGIFSCRGRQNSQMLPVQYADICESGKKCE